MAESLCKALGPSTKKENKKKRRKWLKGEEGGEITMEGVNLAKIPCKHICKYLNVSPCTTITC
jgi:hypothetical protein